MDVLLADLTAAQKYKLISGAIIPRPIALITTLNEDGGVNAAPFSAFNYVSDDPPLVVVGMQPHSSQSSRPEDRKDSCANILRSREFVVNLVDEDLVSQMVGCAADFPRGTSETGAFGIETLPAAEVAPPVIAKAPIAMECRLWRHIEASATRIIIFGEILSMRFRDNILDPENHRIDLDAYRPTGRLFASHYVRLNDMFSIPTPSFASLQAAGSRK